MVPATVVCVQMAMPIPCVKPHHGASVTRARRALATLRVQQGYRRSRDIWMDAILEQCPGVIGIHDDMVIFGVDQQDHDGNLINLLNICQKEGLVLNSKKLEL